MSPRFVPPTRAVLLALVSLSALASLALASTTTRTGHVTNAATVVRPSMAPVRRTMPPPVHEPEVGAPLTTDKTIRESVVGAKSQVAAPALVPLGPVVGTRAPNVPEGSAQTALRQKTATPKIGKARVPHMAPAANGMKTLLELSQSGGRVIG